MCQQTKTKLENKKHLQKSMAKKEALFNQTALDKAYMPYVFTTKSKYIVFQHKLNKLTDIFARGS